MGAFSKMNTQSTKDILSNILNITGYQGNKEQLINQYLTYVLVTAINDLVRLKDKSTQDEIVNALTTQQDNEKEVMGILSRYFEQIIIDEAFKKASERCFTSLLKDLFSNLSTEEEKKVTDYLDTLVASPQ